MAVASVTLTDDALIGVCSHLVPQAMMAALPQTVCLGRIRPKAMPKAVKLESFFDPGNVVLPASTNYREKAAASIARMYRNNVKGCCVISGKAHAFGTWSANDTDSGGILLATDAEIDQQYTAMCGPGDNGCNITDVLDQIKASGFTMSGKQYKIDDYVAVDWTNKILTQATQLIFGATCIGINLPSAWTNAAVWDVTNTRIVGGHDVTPIDYDDKGVYVASWGRIYLITWAAWMQRKWLEEYWAMLAPSWYNADNIAPSGFNVAALKTALSQLSGGTVPNIDPTPPTPPPQPPPTPSPVAGPFTLPAGTYFITAAGGVVPGPNPGDL